MAWGYARWTFRVLLALGVVLGPVTASNRAVGDETSANQISLNFPENLELKVLAEYVSQRLGINILYDEQVGNRRVTIKAPSKIPESSLLGLFESSLMMKGLALVDAGHDGWKRIVPAANLVSIAQGPDAVNRLLKAGQAGPTLAVTQVFHMTHADAKRAEAIIKPFLTQPGGNSISIPENDLLIVTDYMSNMPRITGLVRLVDQPSQEIVIEFLPARFQEAAQLAQQALKLIRAKLNAELRLLGGKGLAAEGLDVTHDDRTNQVVVVGTTNRVADAMNIIQSLDISLNLDTRVYQFTHASPERVDRLAKELIGPLAAKRLYRSAVDDEAGFLVVATTEDVHEKIRSLMDDLDAPLAESQSPIRFYKLTNAIAADVLETIRSLEGDEGLPGSNVVGQDGVDGTLSIRGVSPVPSDQPQSQALGEESQPDEAAAPLQPIRRGVRTSRATMTADTNTNTIIIVAQPQVQDMYARLIRTLDRRRPQVLIEITIVILDTTDNYSLGVELAHAHSAGEGDTITFSSFGLSTINAATAAVTPGVAPGFNAAILAPDIANLVLKALKTDIHSKVISSPRILVNDNATGTLESIAEEPFLNQNVSGDTGDVTQVSFGGYAEAGTTITVTPHISEGDHLSLEYSITLNSFSGTGTGASPPPRNTNSVQSEVTVLNGHTLIVGGLNRNDSTKTVNAIPLLGQIPILKHLFSSESVNQSEGTLFVFIRPAILRGDQFEDLKFLSARRLEEAGLPPDFPTSEPLIIQ